MRATAPPTSPPSSMPIPNGPITGTIGGQSISQPSVSIDFKSGGWDFDVKTGSGAAVGIQSLALNGAGVATKTKSDSGATAHAFLPVNPKNKKSGSIDNITGDRSFFIDITKWDVKPYDSAKGGVQDAGHASGKLYIRADSDIGTSQVAGEFTDADVTYWSDPAKKN